MMMDYRPRPGAQVDPVPRYALEGLALTIVSALAWLASETSPNPSWSLVAVGLYVWTVALLFRLEPRAALLAVPDIIVRSGVLAALVGIEFGNRIPELATVGSPGPHATSYEFITLILFFTYAIAFKAIFGRPGMRPTSPLTPIYDRFANLIGAGVILAIGLITAWVIFRGLLTGFPLLQGVDRFLYRRAFSDKITLYALNDKLTIAFALGMVAFGIPAAWPIRRAAILLTIVFLLTCFLFGDKMTTQLIALSGFLAPYLCFHHRHVLGRNLLPFLVAGTLALVAVSSVTWFIYSNNGRDTPAATIERLSGRIVGTGELWYLQTRIGAPLVNWEGEFISRNIAALKVKEIELYAVQNSLGPNFYSNRYAPDLIRASIARNAGTSTYTAAYEPLLLYTFGWVGLGLALIVTGIISALVASYLMFAIASRSVLSVIFASFISIFWRVTTSQGAPWATFGINSLKWFALIGVIEASLYFLGYAQQGHRRRGRTWKRAARL